MLDAGAVESLVERARRDVDEGVVPACQLALGYAGEVVEAWTFGAAADPTLFPIYSCTKPVVASAVWGLLDDGRLTLDTRVADVVPGFGANGKEVVTLEQVLLHTCGFPRAPMGPAVWADRGARLERMAGWRLTSVPGSSFEYHASSAHWVLAEVITEVAGRDYRAFLRDRVLDPLGLDDLRLGIPIAEQAALDLADVRATGAPATPEEFEAVLGISGLDLGEVTDTSLLRFNEPEVRAVGVPGAGGLATAAAMARFYQALLSDGSGVWSPAMLADATGKVRVRLVDPLLGVPANRSIGLVIAGDDGHELRRGFGHGVSARAFGHDGAGGQVAWADPETGLSFCYLTAGLDRNLLAQGRRLVGLSSRAAACAA